MGSPIQLSHLIIYPSDIPVFALRMYTSRHAPSILGGSHPLRCPLPPSLSAHLNGTPPRRDPEQCHLWCPAIALHVSSARTWLRLLGWPPLSAGQQACLPVCFELTACAPLCRSASLQIPALDVGRRLRNREPTAEYPFHVWER